jgi:hypothetical protein
VTQVPPPRLPGASCEPPQPDPPLDEWLEDWLAAQVAHRQRVRAEARRFAREIDLLRGQLAELHDSRLPPCETAGDPPIGGRIRWQQETLFELEA